jgi:hypothetical protein
MALSISGCAANPKPAANTVENKFVSLNSVRDLGFDFDFNVNYPSNWSYIVNSSGYGYLDNNYGEVTFLQQNGWKYDFKLEIKIEAPVSSTKGIFNPAVDSYDKEFDVNGYKGYFVNHINYDFAGSNAGLFIQTENGHQPIDNSKIMEFIIPNLPQGRSLQMEMLNSTSSDQALFWQVINSISLNNVNTKFVASTELDKCEKGILNGIDGTKEYYNRCYNYKFSFQDKKNNIFLVNEGGKNNFRMSFYYQTDYLPSAGHPKDRIPGKAEQMFPRLSITVSSDEFSDEQTLRQFFEASCNGIGEFTASDCKNTTEKMKISKIINKSGIELFKVDSDFFPAAGVVNGSYYAAYAVENKYVKSIVIGGEDKMLVKQAMDSFDFLQ